MYLIQALAHCFGFSIHCSPRKHIRGGVGIQGGNPVLFVIISPFQARRWEAIIKTLAIICTCRI